MNELRCVYRLDTGHYGGLDPHILSLERSTLSELSASHSAYSMVSKVDCFWNVMAHAQKPDFVFLRNGRVHLNRRGRQFSLLAAEVCATAVVMLDTPCSEVVWRVLATHSILQFPLHFPSLRHCLPSHFSWTLPVDTTCSGTTQPHIQWVSKGGGGAFMWW